MKLLISIGMMMMIGGCTKASYYEVDKITDLSVQKNAQDLYEVSFLLPMETMYYSPGLEKNKEGTYQILRTKFDEKKKVDLPLKLENNTYKMTLTSEEVQTMKVIDKSGKSLELSSYLQ